MYRVLLVLAVLALTPLARAAPPLRPALHWSRTAEATSCIDPRALALRVSALTGPVLVAASDADVAIEGHIERTRGGTFRARITASSRDGVQRGARTLEQAGDCRGLDAALAFVIALLIDPDLVLQKLPPELVALGAEGPAAEQTLLAELEAKPPVPFVPAPAPQPVATPAVSPAPPTRAFRYRVETGFLFALAELPRASAGAFVGLAFAPRRWLALELWLRTSFMLGPHELDQHALRAQAFAGAVVVCPRYARERYFVDFCAGPDATVVRAKGSGFESNDTGYLGAAGAVFAAGVGVSWSERWLLHLRGVGRVLFNQPHFTYALPDGTYDAFTLPRAGAELSLSAGYAF